MKAICLMINCSFTGKSFLLIYFAEEENFRFEAKRMTPFKVHIHWMFTPRTVKVPFTHTSCLI